MRAFYSMVQYTLLGSLLSLGTVLGEPTVPQRVPTAAVEELLPANKATLDVMQLAFPERLVELTKQIQQAAAKDFAWWMAHLKNAKVGEPLPYDVRLGVTRAEYEEYLGLTKKMTFKKVGAVTVTVNRANKAVVLDFGDQLPNLTKLTLNLEADTVITPFGVATKRSQIMENERQTATGPWNGIEWAMETTEEQPQRTTARIAFGILKDSGRGIMCYRAHRVSEQSRVDVYYVFQYDLKRVP